ncbi:MAG: 4-hydroxyphenylpyruvate dioxygenase (EC [uncultured Caballeronia sp.]|nr:MAG: 4-hydroxyphenylpyruvate dioxygenase (EC [uncultured Caballeronia sp.]
MELNIPAIKGVGDSLIYFVDRWRGKNGAQPGSIGDISIYDTSISSRSPERNRIRSVTG